MKNGIVCVVNDMKCHNLFFLSAMALFALLLTACSDNSSSADEEPFNASVVCPENLRGTFTDPRDGQVYKYTTIGNQVWMAENLKFNAPYSLCYDEIEGFCETFGRFYTLHENGEDLGHFDQELLDTICPAGWHVPSVDEWNVLIEKMGGGGNAISRLYSSSIFGERYEPGSDDCAFNSLPAGYWLKNGNLSNVYISSVYWTSTAKTAHSSYSCSFDKGGVTFWVNDPKMTIRCVKN